MTTKTKGRNGGDRPTLDTADVCNRTAIASCFKALIVGAACWGFLPVTLAEWCIRRFRLEGE